MTIEGHEGDPMVTLADAKGTLVIERTPCKDGESERVVFVTTGEPARRLAAATSNNFPLSKTLDAARLISSLVGAPEAGPDATRVWYLIEYERLDAGKPGDVPAYRFEATTMDLPHGVIPQL